MSYYRTALVPSIWNFRGHRVTKDSHVSAAMIITQRGQSPLYRRDLLHAVYLERNAMSMKQPKKIEEWLASNTPDTPVGLYHQPRIKLGNLPL
jgi:hypothetical protein